MKRFIFVVLALFSGDALAAQCNTVFADGVGSSSFSSKIKFEKNAVILNSSGFLNAIELDDQSGGNSCFSQPCTLSGDISESLSLPSYQYSSSSNKITVAKNGSGSATAGDYEEITLEQGASFSFTSADAVYIIKSFKAGKNAVITMAPGDYWIETFELEQGVDVSFSGDGTVRLYTNQAKLGKNVEMNVSGGSDRLVLTAMDQVTLEQGAEIEGFIYAENSFKAEKNVVIKGAVNAEEIELGQGVELTYEESQLDEAAFDGMCTSQGVSLISHWPIDVCSLNGSANEIVDLIGSNNGQSVDGANIKTDGKYCQAGDFAGSGQHINIPHSNTFNLSSGSISMWFRATDLSHSNDRGHGGMGLFSKDSNGTDNGGYHLTIWLESNGSMFVRHQDLTNSHEITTNSGIVSENQWHHLVYTFGTGGMKLYLDTNLVGTDSFNGGIATNPEPIVLASNAWTTGNGEAEPSLLKDHFLGQIDDVKIYSGELTQALINDLNSEAQGTCETCVVEDVLEAYWPMDVCSVDGSNGEIIDTVNGYNGQTVSGGAISDQGKFCNAGDFDGSGAHINIPYQSAFGAGQGSLSLWFQTPDLNHSQNADQGGQGLISRDSSGFDGGGHLSMWVQSSGAIRVRHQSTSASHEINTSSVVSEDTWHHLVYTWGSNGMQLYLDGNSIGSKSSYTGGLAGNEEPFIFGANAWTSGDDQAPPSELSDFFQGQMDDVRFYSNQINADTISDLYNQSQYACQNCGDQQLLFYQFEEDNWSGTGDVIDASGLDYNGTALGGATPENPNEQVSCKVLDVPSNTSDSVYEGVSTGLDVNEIGNKGTISFWYRSDEAWNSGNDRQLFDASTSSGGGNNRYFHLTIRPNGKLDFRLEDTGDRRVSIRSSSSYSYAADEWVHVAVTWDMSSHEMTLHLNGVSQSVTDNSESGLSNNIGDFNTLYIGDNRSDYLPGSSTGNSANGQFDDFRVYNYLQNTSQIVADMDNVTSCQQVHHYRIIHDAAALTCEAETITLKACANDACDEVAEQASTVILEPFTQSITVNSDDADGQDVAVSHTTAEILTLSLSGQSPQAENDLRCYNSQTPGASEIPCDIVFANAGFEIFGASAGVDVADQLAAQNFTDINLRAVKDNNGVCEALLQGTQTVDMSYSCQTPSSCKTALEFGATILSPSASVDLVFDNQGVAPLTSLIYKDAGLIDLAVSAVVGGVTIESGQHSVLVYPDKLDLTTSDSTGFFDAGGEFTLNIRALGADGSVLKNYQPGNLQFKLERTAPIGATYVDGDLAYSASSILSSSVGAGFTNVAISTFVDGIYSFNQANYSEAGALTLDVQDSLYHGRTGPIENVSDLVLGEFIPAYFGIEDNSPTFLNTYVSGTPFSYYGRPFEFQNDPELTITAYNSEGQVTENYQSADDWNWLPDQDELAAITFSDGAHTGGISVHNSGEAGVPVDVSLGSRQVALSDIEVIYNRASTPEAPLSANASMTIPANFFLDNSHGSNPICFASDTANPAQAEENCDDFTIAGITGASLRWGRVVLENAFGPENEDKLISVKTEYFVDEDTGFVLNRDDSLLTNFVVTGSNNYELTDIDDDLADITDDANISVQNVSFDVFSGKSTSYEGFKISPNVEGLRGRFIFELVPVNDSTITWDDYLQFDWNGPSEAGIGNPSAEVSFGQYRGNDRIIHWREVFN